MQVTPAPMSRNGDVVLASALMKRPQGGLLPSPTLLLGFALLGACGDDKPRYEDSCEHNCGRAQECSASVDLQTCIDRCKTGLGGIGPNLRSDYLAGIDACVATQSCAELALGAIFTSCPRESRAQLAPSEAAKSLCRDIQASLSECAGLQVGTATCLETVKVFSDATLARAARCTGESCDRRLSCLVQDLGVDPTLP